MGEFLAVVVICVAIGAVLIPWLLGQRHREDMASVAFNHGLEYSHSDPFGCTRVAFPLFRKGDGRTAENVVWRDQRSEHAEGLALRAFDFTYWVEREDNAGNVVRSNKHFSCAMAQVDGAWPDVSITREGILEKALDLVGLGDIQLESDEFNRRYALRSPDRRFAVTLIDARMIDFLLSTEARFSIFVKGRWVLVASDPLPPDLVPALLNLTETFVKNIPRVVYELWPSPFRDAEGRPLAVGDEGYGDALAAAELAEKDPWSVLRSNPYEALEEEGRPQYDLDGNVIEPKEEDPWGRKGKPRPE